MTLDVCGDILHWKGICIVKADYGHMQQQADVGQLTTYRTPKSYWLILTAPASSAASDVNASSVTVQITVNITAMLLESVCCHNKRHMVWRLLTLLLFLLQGCITHLP